MGGADSNEIAGALRCHPQTVRVHLARFNTEGRSGLGMQSGSGRKPRLSEQERSRILAPVKRTLPGQLERQGEGLLAVEDWCTPRVCLTIQRSDG